MLATHKLCQHPNNPYAYTIPLTIALARLTIISDGLFFSILCLWHTILGIGYSFVLNGWHIPDEANMVLRMIDNTLKSCFMLYLLYFFFRVPMVYLRSFCLTWRMSQTQKDAIYAHK